MDWNLSQEQRLKFLELMNSMGVRYVYFPSAIAEKLQGCGIPASVDESESGLVIESERISKVELGSGEPGIYGPMVLKAVIKINRLKLESDMTGSGFHFRHLLTQLAVHWGIDKNYI